MSNNESKVASSLKVKTNNLKLIISNYYSSFSNEFTVLVNDTTHVVETKGILPSNGHLILNMESGRHKVSIEQTNSLIDIINTGTVQDFEFDIGHGKYFLLEYNLNHLNESSLTIIEVSEPFEDPNLEKNILISELQTEDIFISKKVKQIVRAIGYIANKTLRALSFREK